MDSIASRKGEQHMQEMYLRQNIVVEPLVDQWYAWSHIISPATAAMNIMERHIKIMESYIKTPQVHANAVKNPALLGGPFIDYGGKRVDEIKALLTKTKEERAQMLAFAKAIKELDALLRNEANGYSLEPLYNKIPEILRGYVELVYDLNNHPSFRLIEPMLYKSPFYDPAAQSLMLSVINQDDRPFVLSTPRLESEEEVHLRIPFNHPGIDELFRMKTEPQTFAAIKDRLGFEDKYDDLFLSFLTEEKPPEYKRYTDKGIRWRYFGHACILIETRNISILSDPVLSYTYESDISRYTYQDLPDQIDYAVITHNHQDHILFETMLQLRHKIKTIVVPRSGGGALQDPSLKLLLNNIGFEHVIEIDELQEILFEGGSITGIPFFGEHADLNIRSKMAYLVRVNGHSLLLAADSCNIEPTLYQHIHDYVGDIEVCFLGMECDGAPLTWLYGPLITQNVERKMDQSRRLAGSNYERGIDIVNRFHCKEVYVYAMGQEPWLNYVMSIKYSETSNPIVASNKLIQDCLSRGIVAERLFGEKEIFVD
jgi:L-ascorbate metabolism protein UlaG (beta-lactamase superfamily)